MVKPNLMVNTCLLCGGELKRETPFYRCKECGEKYDPDEVGFTLDMPANPYRGDKPQKKGSL